MSSADTAKLLSFFVIVFLSMTIIVSTVSADTVDPWTDIPENEVVEWGEMWGNTIQFQYTYDPEMGNQAQTIEWDFGDGSARSTEWNPRHTYTQPGTYIVVQHVANSYDGYSEDWGYYCLTIMGKPYVQIITPEGAPSMEKAYTTIRTAPVMPEDPAWEGHTFIGYYADPELTIPFDWSTELYNAVTAYAAFTESPAGPEDPDDPDVPGQVQDGIDGYIEFIQANLVLIIGIAAGLVFAVYALGYRHPIVLIVGIALAVIAVLIHQGVI